MGWLFGKKEEKTKKEKKKEVKIPKLPELPPLPSELGPPPKPIPGKIKDELPPLPSFPTSATGDKLGRETVKQTMREPPEEVPIGKPGRPLTRELEEKELTGYSLIPKRTVVKETKPLIKPQPVFVRIDKYEKSMAKFQEVKKKILEIENILREVKELKGREETELQEWEQEIQDAKNKLDEIDQTIFQKLEE
jgi:hypothetical protein